MRSADWIGKRLLAETDVAFGVTGGCIISAVDGFYKQGLRLIPMHHEQSAAMAADAYSRMTGKLGLCYSTSGPGGQNMLTGLACAYFDSIPVLGIVGQVPSKQYKKTGETHGLRQFGFQESWNSHCAKPITKYAVAIEDAEQIQPELERCILAAKSGRGGSVVYELCDDMQRAEVEETEIVATHITHAINDKGVKQWFSEVLAMTKTAKHPVLILGAGMTLAGVRDKAVEFVNRMKMPVLLSWGGKDLLPEDNQYYVGGFGICAERTGNFALKHADVIIAVGCRLDTHSFGPKYDWLDGKRLIVVDSDEAELNKLPDCVKIRIDVADVIATDLGVYDDPWTAWLEAIKLVRRLYPVNDCKAQDDEHSVVGWNPYAFFNALSDKAPSNAVIVADAGQTLAWTFQSWETKEGQRLFSDFNNSCMGYATAASIGAAIACPDKPVFCIVGDGSFMMNLQDLQTIREHNMNIRIFVVDNDGYGMIKQTQSDWPWLSQGVSCDNRTRLTFPDYRAVANAFGLAYVDCQYDHDIEYAVNMHGPSIVRVPIQRGSKIAPKLLFGDDLWNQKPYLSKEAMDAVDTTLSV